jgi:hypothetical protein
MAAASWGFPPRRALSLPKPTCASLRRMRHGRCDSDWSDACRQVLVFEKGALIVRIWLRASARGTRPAAWMPWNGMHVHPGHIRTEVHCNTSTNPDGKQP